MMWTQGDAAMLETRRLTTLWASTACSGISVCIASNVIVIGKWLIWKGFWRSNFRYYPGIYLEGLRKITENLSHDSRCSSPDSNRTPTEWKPWAVVLHQFAGPRLFVSRQQKPRNTEKPPQHLSASPGRNVSKYETHTKPWSAEIWGKNHLEDQDVNGHITLKCIVEERGIDWIQLAQDTVQRWVD
jgi:hypothetical protein